MSNKKRKPKDPQQTMREAREKAELESIKKEQLLEDTDWGRWIRKQRLDTVNEGVHHIRMRDDIRYRIKYYIKISILPILIVGGVAWFSINNWESNYSRTAEYQVNSICIKKYPPPRYATDMNEEFRNKYIGDELVESIPIKDEGEYSSYWYDELMNRWERENWECPDPNTDSYPKPDYFYANARNFIVGIFK